MNICLVFFGHFALVANENVPVCSELRHSWWSICLSCQCMMLRLGWTVRICRSCGHQIFWSLYLQFYLLK